MSSKSDPSINIGILVTASNPNLLRGLDYWLELGLISNAQVRRLSQTYLTCLVPEPAVASVAKAKPISLPTDIDWEDDSLPVAPPLTPSPVAQMWQSLWDELSVRWLLFLGVFLVVVSSGVLAATQWQNFPAVAQYGVLWAYTVIFWGGSVWAGKQRNLQLTAQTLGLITLLLMPVNFWAMDSFGLWRNPLEWVVMAGAAGSLTAITLFHQELSNHRSRFASNASLLLGLSYLHWGWHFLGFPLIAVYIGMVGTALLLPKFLLKQTSQTVQSQRVIGSSIVIYALTVLLGRAIFIVNLPLAQLGLALGICGWLFSRLIPVNDSPKVASFKLRVWSGIGAGLLLVGWLVSVNEPFPWQAVAVSGLGLWFCASRLRRFWRRLDFLGIFVIGVQGQMLFWRLFPAGLRKSAIINVSQLLNLQSASWAFPSVSLLPFTIAIIFLIDWLHRASKPQLARFGERLVFCFGVLLTLVSLAHPVLRSLNLVVSTLTLAVVTARWLPIRRELVYITHVAGLLAGASLIDWLFPNLNQPIWAAILLVAMAIEWAFSLLNAPSLSIWQTSSWYLGFVLSGISYVLLFTYLYPGGVYSLFLNSSNQSILVWLLTPITLTVLASRRELESQKESAWFSITALFMAQVLTIASPGIRLVSLGISTGLMWVNTRYLKQSASANITIGFGLTFLGMLLWEGIPGLAKLTLPDWLIANAIAFSILWLSRSLLQRLTGTTPALYAQASDSWAKGLYGVELLLLSSQSIAGYSGFISADIRYLLASVLTAFALIYRCWRQPNNTSVYSFIWAVELIVAQAMLLVNGNILDLAIANLILGLVTLLVSDVWAIRYRRSIPLSSIEIAPLFYGVLALILRIGYFNNWTGLLTLGTALIGIGVGRRRAEWKSLTYLSLAGITVAWYELVIYQLMQATGGSNADGLMILASVATAIAIFYRLLAWMGHLRNFALLNFSVSEIKATAHLHWLIGSLLMIAAVQNALSIPPNLKIVNLFIGLVLASYALLQGRCQELVADKNSNDLWVYLGLAELVGIIYYARVIWTELAGLDPHFSTISYVLAFAIYQIPWQRWGWRRTPWRRATIVLPLLVVLATSDFVSDIGLLGVAAFYIWVSQLRNNVRFTYLSLILIDWSILRWFDRLKLTDSLWFTIVVGLSLLYIAQFDPNLKQPQQRQLRHYLRLVGSGAICLVALVNHQDTGSIPGLIPGIISFITIFAGLILRIRAFLFVGTATFLLTSFYQLVILISRHGFIKWIIGLVAGIIFIVTAANFETRREQIKAILRSSRHQLREWE